MTHLSLLLADDETPVRDLPSFAEAGQDSTVLELHLWNWKNAEEGQTARNLLIGVRTQSPLDPALWLANGVPPQDELWWRVRIVGFDNRGDASWTIASTDWRSLGANAGLEIASIPPDCAVHLEALRHPPSTADVGTWRYKFVFYYDEYSQPLPRSAGLVHRGIVTGIGDREHSAVVAGCAVSVSDPPDDRVHVAAGRWVHRGVLHGKVATEHALDQADVDGAHLAPGESFWAALTLGATGATMTKGRKAIEPQRPAPPASETLLVHVRVEYDPGGAPGGAAVIDAADVDGSPLYDRFALEPGTGLAAVLHAGRSISAAAWQWRAHRTSLSLAPNTMSYLWLLESGRPQIATTSEPPATAAALLFEIDTDAARIVAVRDCRRYATPSRILTLDGELPALPGEIGRLTVLDDRLSLERLVVDVPDLGGGTAGETVFDVIVNGTSIYASSNTDDQRPRVAAGAAGEPATVTGGVAEQLELHRGDIVQFVTVEHADAAPPWARASLFFWSG